MGHLTGRQHPTQGKSATGSGFNLLSWTLGLNETPETLTPWFKLEWADLRSGRHAEILENIGLHWSRESEQ
ncbi:MAG: hypothetical protein CM15mP74_31230 [Halieaceae bacterium]|nr:MAG: hypothetical protein CM15mP74_31230 [Halieaceae bacterium]